MNGFHYKQMHHDYLRIIVYPDCFFTGKDERSIQVGDKIFLADKQKNANLIDYERKKSKWFVHSVIGAETFELTEACLAYIDSTCPQINNQ